MQSELSGRSEQYIQLSTVGICQFPMGKWMCGSFQLCLSLHYMTSELPAHAQTTLHKPKLIYLLEGRIAVLNPNQYICSTWQQHIAQGKLCKSCPQSQQKLDRILTYLCATQAPVCSDHESTRVFPRLRPLPPCAPSSKTRACSSAQGIGEEQVLFLSCHLQNPDGMLAEHKPVDSPQMSNLSVLIWTIKCRYQIAI